MSFEEAVLVVTALQIINGNDTINAAKRFRNIVKELGFQVGSVPSFQVLIDISLSGKQTFLPAAGLFVPGLRVAIDPTNSATSLSTVFVPVASPAPVLASAPSPASTLASDPSPVPTLASDDSSPVPTLASNPSSTTTLALNDPLVNLPNFGGGSSAFSKPTSPDDDLSNATGEDDSSPFGDLTDALRKFHAGWKEMTDDKIDLYVEYDNFSSEEDTEGVSER